MITFYKYTNGVLLVCACVCVCICMIIINVVTQIYNPAIYMRELFHTI